MKNRKCKSLERQTIQKEIYLMIMLPISQISLTQGARVAILGAKRAYKYERLIRIFPAPKIKTEISWKNSSRLKSTLRTPTN
jgi:hypothetical protein